MKSRQPERPELISRSQSAGSTFKKSTPPQSKKGKDKAVDFSDLFGFGDGEPSKSLEPTPKTSGMARRMLGRTQSGPPSRGSPSDSNVQDLNRRQPLLCVKGDAAIDLTEETIPTTPIKVTKSTSFDDHPPPTDGRATNLRTYGGPSRSFLIAIPANQIPPLSDSQLTEDSVASLLQTQEDEFGGHESYTSLRSRWGVDNSEDDPYQPRTEGSTTWLTKKKGKSGRPPIPLSGPSNSELRSITELRNTGEIRRFNDEVGYLFEGMTVESEPSVKRGRRVHPSSYQWDADQHIQCRRASKQDGRLAVLSQGPV